MTETQPEVSPTLQATLRSLAELPVEQHPMVFEAIHAELQASLATLDEL